MRVECFEFKRCCFCIPLRYGLLVCGYLKLVISLLLILPTMFWDFKRTIQRPVNYFELAIVGLFILVVLCDIALTVVFLVGCHKKRPKLLKVYNYYSFGLLAFFIAVYVFYIGYVANMLNPLNYRLGLVFFIIALRTIIITGLVQIGLQVYLILLNKAEIAKLESNCNFRFSNNANEAECRMDAEGNIIGNSIKNSEPETEVDNENQTATNVINSEPEYKVKHENDCMERKLNGNYVKLV